MEAILNEIHTYCGTECCSSNCCPEDDCVLFRIERMVINNGLGKSQGTSEDNESQGDY